MENLEFLNKAQDSAAFLEKAKDVSKLQKKIITDKKGRQKTVWVKREEQHSSKKDSGEKEFTEIGDIKDSHDSKSNKAKRLAELGMETKDIAKHLGMHYSHAYSAVKEFEKERKARFGGTSDNGSSKMVVTHLNDGTEDSQAHHEFQTYIQQLGGDVHDVEDYQFISHKEIPQEFKDDLNENGIEALDRYKDVKLVGFGDMKDDHKEYKSVFGKLGATMRKNPELKVGNGKSFVIEKN